MLSFSESISRSERPLLCVSDMLVIARSWVPTPNQPVRLVSLFPMGTLAKEPPWIQDSSPDLYWAGMGRDEQYGPNVSDEGPNQIASSEVPG